MDGNELGAIRERGFNLHVGDHFRHSLHHVFAGEQGTPVAHQFSHCLAVPRPFHDRRTDECDGLRVIQLQSSRLAPFGEQGGSEQQ